MEQQRIPLLLALGIIIFLLWDAWMTDYVRKPKITQTPTQQIAPQINNAAQNGEDVPAAAASNTQTLQPTTSNQPISANINVINVKTEVLDLDISLKGGTITRADLIAYPIDSKQKDKPVRLLDNRTHFKYLAQSGLQSKTDSVDHHTQYQSAQSEMKVTAENMQLVLSHTTAKGLKVEKVFTFSPNAYVIGVEHKIINQTGASWTGNQYRQLSQNERGRESQLLYTYTGGVYSGNIPNSTDDVPYERVSFDDMSDSNLSQELMGGWVAMIQHYFLSGWIPENQNETNLFYTLTSNKQTQPLYTLGLSSSAKTIPAGNADTFSSKLYIGPKLQDDLKKIAPNLNLTVDYGMWSVFSEPIFWVLKKIQSVVINWGWSIILLTIVIKILFLYPSTMSYRSMANMRKVSPKLQKMKERFGDDRQRMGQEMMKLYKEEKINPAGGCLPILLQIPVFIALYWVLLESVELRQAPWVLWYEDLSKPDPYFLLPALMALSMFVQQKLNPPPTDEMQRKIFQFMPWVFGVFFAFFPAGLVLYWVVNNIFSIAHQWWITRGVEAAPTPR